MNDPNATTGQKVAYGMDTLLSAAGTAFAVKGFMNSIKCSTPQTNTNQKVQDIADEGTGGGNVEPARTEPQQLARDGQTPTIGKMKDLNTSGVVTPDDFKLADYLPDMGNPQANWNQNDGILRSVMNEGVPIKDVSPFPMDNAGFLGAERNLLQTRGWSYFEGYWYPTK